MRTKHEILDNYDDFKSQGRTSTDLRMFIELARLEVFIDIRDILDNRLLEIDRGLHALSKKD